MRDIKFKGKCIDSIQDKQKWVHGCYVQMWHDGHITDYIYSIKDGWHEIISGTQAQYTGLKDKSGVEIYEGDILSKDNSVVIWSKSNGSWIVRYKDSFGEHWPSLWICANHHEVIGNTYERPDLLKQD